MFPDTSVISRLKRNADLYPLTQDTGEMPDRRHWAESPNGVRVCFTKWEIPGQEPLYHLSVSTPYGKPDDKTVFALLASFGVRGIVKETPGLVNSSVRHFWWSPEQLGGQDVPGLIQ